MKNVDYFCVNANGRIVRKGFAPEDMVGFQIPHDGEVLHIGSSGAATHYIGGQFLTQPRQPSESHVWDDATFSWILDINIAKQNARDRINAERNMAEAAGFFAYGKRFDSDSVSQQRIIIAANTAQMVGESFSIDWTTADNSVITLDYTQMVNLPVIMAQAGSEIHQKARTLKCQIDAATTIGEIDSIIW